jgi:cytochrome c biogenesis protein CcdA
VSAPLLYPFTLGMLAAVNPCGFPVLPAYLELFVGGGSARAGSARGQDVGLRATRAVTAGAFCTLGFVGLFGLLGLLVNLGLSAVSNRSADLARYAMVCAGVAMIVVGAASLLNKPLRLHLPEIRGGLGLKRPAALAIFGVSYGVASIGCALPLFIGGVATSFTHENSLTGSENLVSYALGMGAVLSGLALAIAVFGTSAARPLRRLSRFVPVVGASILVIVGLYLVGYWISAIVDPTSSAPGQGWVTSVQVRVATAIDGHAVLVGSLLGAAIIAVIVSAGVVGNRRQRPSTSQESPVAGTPVTTDDLHNRPDQVQTESSPA